jgi:enoyl-[acyl-carrier protein] reductase I
MTEARTQQAGPDWLGLGGKTVVVLGFANKKSVAWHVARRLAGLGAHVVHVVRSTERAAELRALLGTDADVLVCDVERPAEIVRLRTELALRHARLDGLVHSIAFANYERGLQPFHATERADFLQAMDVSCFSLVALANALRELFAPHAAVVTLSISHTHMAAESYGYMGPVKAALDSAVAFLAKSFADTGVRFNAVKAGLLKTSASAGIPGYLDNYIYAEGATLRHRALATEEVADTVLFLLSERSSGINAQGVVVDAGMSVNFFDRDLVRRATRPMSSEEPA